MKKIWISLSIILIIILMVFFALKGGAFSLKTDEEYLDEVKIEYENLPQGEEISIYLKEDTFGTELAEFKMYMESDEIYGNVKTDGKTFVKIMPMPDFLNNKNYYFKEGKLAIYEEEFMGIGGSVRYFFRNDDLICIDESNIEPEMIFQAEKEEEILKRATLLKEEYLK